MNPTDSEFSAEQASITAITPGSALQSQVEWMQAQYPQADRPEAGAVQSDETESNETAPDQESYPQDPLESLAPALQHLQFWRQRWAQELVPLLTSILLHAAIIVIGIATFKAAAQITHVSKEQIIIPDAAMAVGSDAGGIPNPGMNTDSDRTAGQDVDPTVTQFTGMASARADLTNTLLNTTGDNAPLLSSIVAAQGQSGTSLNNSASEGSGTPAPFALPGGGQGIGPHGKVFGHGGNATKIVFICDGSGSMNAKMDALKACLSESVDGLIARQAFDVIFFQEGDKPTDSSQKFIDLSPDLLMASADNKKRLYSFLRDVVGRGQTYAIPALSTAFHKGTRPDLIYLLTDGAFEEETGDAVVAAVAKLNADKLVKINTVLLTGSELDAKAIASARQTLEKIAQQNGGVCKVQSIKDL